MITDYAPTGNLAYRHFRPREERRPAPNEPGTLMQQFLAIDLYLSAQQEERRTGTAARRLWTVCHCLATDRPIHCEVRS